MHDLDTRQTNASGNAAVLLNRNFLLLWQGQFVSQIGNQAYMIAMMYWLMEASGSATLMGLMMMTSMLPGVVLGPVGGAIADRHSRKLIIVSSDFLRGFSVLIVAAMLYVSPNATVPVLAGLFSISLLNGLISAAFQPAMSAAIPDLVPPDKVEAANSLNQFSVQVAILVGQATGGILYRVVGAPILFALDGMSYIASAISETFIKLPKKATSPPTKSISTLATYRADTIQGIRYVWGRVGMRSLLLVSAGINFLAMPVIVLLPFFVSRELSKGPEWYGFLLAAIGAGALFGYLIVGAVRIPAGKRPVVVITLLLAVGVTIALAGAINAPGVVITSFFIMGVCTGAINIIVITLFQTASPAEMRGRVMSLVFTLSGAASPLGMALGGVLGDLTNKKISAVYIGCGLLISFVALFAASQSSLRKFLTFESALVS